MTHPYVFTVSSRMIRSLLSGSFLKYAFFRNQAFFSEQSAFSRDKAPFFWNRALLRRISGELMESGKGFEFDTALRCLCTTLQHTATHCNTLQHTATHCNTVSVDECKISGSFVGNNSGCVYLCVHVCVCMCVCMHV